MAKRFMFMLFVLGVFGCFALNERVVAQDAPAAPVAEGMELSEEAAAAAAEEGSSGGIGSVIFGGGFVGTILWLAIFGTSIAGVSLIVDSFVNIREKKIMPEHLVGRVQEAMEQGDVMKALQHCEDEPCPLSNILSAGFSNVEEGFEVVQDSVTITGEMESEWLMQKINYLNVVGNLAPMLGLLGTVQGMIMAFATLGSAAGAAKQSMLAVNISLALWTTAAGLAIAIPAVAFYFFFRNRAAKIILKMESLSLDLFKALRNVELVEE